MYRMQSSEEAHQKSTVELRQLLTAQYRVGTRCVCVCVHTCMHALACVRACVRACVCV